jgi:hypothetical protein
VAGVRILVNNSSKKELKNKRHKNGKWRGMEWKFSGGNIGGETLACFLINSKTAWRKIAQNEFK